MSFHRTPKIFATCVSVSALLIGISQAHSLPAAPVISPVLPTSGTVAAPVSLQAVQNQTGDVAPSSAGTLPGAAIAPQVRQNIGQEFSQNLLQSTDQNIGQSASGIASDAPSSGFGNFSQAAAAGLPSQNPNLGRPAALTFLIDQDISLIYIGNDGGVRGYLGVSSEGQFQNFYIWPNGKDFVAGDLYDRNGDDVTTVQLEKMHERFKSAVAGATAQQPPPFEGVAATIAPNADPVNIPALHNMVQAGDKIIYLGGDGGTAGYMVAKSDPASGHIVYSEVYITPDGDNLVVGNMLDDEGQDVTGIQVRNAMSSGANATLITDIISGTQIGGGLQTQTSAGAATSSSLPSLPAESAGTLGAASPTTPSPAQTTGSLPGAPIGEQMSGGISTPSNVVAEVSEADFMAGVAGVAKFSVGYSDAPEVYMVADPQCPHCHAAWSILRPLILKHKIKVDVILINALSGSNRLNQEIMTNPRPGLVWLDGWSSDPAMVQPTPTADQQDYKQAAGWLSDNMAFVQALGIRAVPFIAYHGQDGVWRADQGPPDVAAFLSGDTGASN